MRGHLEGVVRGRCRLDDLTGELGREALRLVVDREQQHEARAAVARDGPQRERGVGDVFDRRAGVHQPRVSSAEPDQPLVHLVGGATSAA